MATFTRWIRGFCQGFFPFFHDYILLQKSPRATFCHFCEHFALFLLDGILTPIKGLKNNNDNNNNNNNNNNNLNK